LEFDVNIDEELELVKCHITGIITLHNIKDAIEGIMAKCEEVNWWSILVDVREATMEMDLGDFTYLSAMNETFEFDPCFKQAFVISERTFNLEFYERMRQEKGAVFQMFKDIEEAKKWLSTC